MCENDELNIIHITTLISGFLKIQMKILDKIMKFRRDKLYIK